MRERHHDGDGWEIVTETSQNVEPILDNNKAWQSASAPDGPLGRKVASIPMVVALKWFQEDGVFLLNMPKAERARYLARKLNDPDWRHLKTTAGSV